MIVCPKAKSMHLSRRNLFRSAIGATALAASPLPSLTATRYQPTLESLNQHPVPAWYDDAKLGIFVHWGLYSVPGWAPIQKKDHNFQANDWFRFNPYSEWYYNTVRIDGSPTQKYHREKYGADFDYYQFAPQFNKAAEQWNPDHWAQTFSDAGAKYVVLTTKHHDGFVLWPSRISNPHLEAAKQRATRDLVGDLTKAVRRRNLKMGTYYSGGFDWTFLPGPFVTPQDSNKGTPQTEEYARYIDSHYRELMERYQPSFLWNDIRYSPKGQLLQIFADYYNTTPEGLVDDRWSPFKHADLTTPEYQDVPDIREKKWEECRGLGASFGYNRAEGEAETIASDKLVHMLVDIVSKNGNLLLDVGPEADGTIPAVQMDRLKHLGAWMKINSEAIYGTRPWKRAVGKTSDGLEVRFTRKGADLYAVLFGRPKQSDIQILDLGASAAKVELLGSGRQLQSKAAGNHLQIDFPVDFTDPIAPVLKLSGVA